VTAVVFDIGGVLIDWNPRYVYRELFDGDEAAMEHFLAHVCSHDWNLMQDADKVEKHLIESRSIAGGIARASRDYDLVVIGAAREPLFRKILFGEIPEKVARFSPTTVLVVKKYEGVVKSILKKIMG